MSLKQNFRGFKNGDIFCFKNKRYKAVGQDGCDGCCWQHPKGCNYRKRWKKNKNNIRKTMSKAKEIALEKYPAHSVLIVPARGGGYYADSHLREGFIEGYQQAEKDLELTWKDVKLIWNITDEMDNMPEEEFYQEVLKRFKYFKERKEKNDIRRH